MALGGGMGEGNLKEAQEEEAAECVCSLTVHEQASGS